jgi:hypothetical protein
MIQADDRNVWRRSLCREQLQHADRIPEAPAGDGKVVKRATRLPEVLTTHHQTAAVSEQPEVCAPSVGSRVDLHP